MRKLLFLSSILMLSVLLGAAAGAQEEGDGSGEGESQENTGLTAESLSPGEAVEVPKSPTSRLAETDPSLLNLEGSEPVNVIVKLDYDSVATYTGGVEDLRPTSPQVTGRSLDANTSAVDAYRGYVRSVEADVRDDISNEVPQAEVTNTFRVAYGGLAMQIPADQVEALLDVEGVVAVQRDELNQPLTDVTPEFTGASAAWEELGGDTKAGEGVKVGVLDSGIWPEHASFEDQGVDNPGGAYGCEFGNGSEEFGERFNCNDKLLGAYAFTDTYMSVIDAEEGEFCNNETDECSARDADGHGTHTASTAAGNSLESAEIFGIERGPLSGIAPGAHVLAYRVCLSQGCFGSDSVAAVEQAILDDVDVINFSISGGEDAFTDPVELTFLDAYATGILANASAGNEGPGSATANHAGPWTNTVGASTSDRHFFTNLVLDAANGDRFRAQGVTITPGIRAFTPTIHARDVDGYEDALCTTPMEPGMAEGQVVVCERGENGRADKGFNVNEGDAEGMILYNVGNEGLFTDNHFLPTVMLNGPQPSGDLVEYLNSHDEIESKWKTGQPTEVRGDVMAQFSSRGPLGDFIKPDITAPGVQILAGNTPEPVSLAAGPPGELFQVIAGTSMSSPHAAGVSALVKAAHPDWTPGQIKSALMTSSVQDVLKEDGETPSDPFDRGAGSIRADRALDPALTFDVTAGQYYASAADPDGRVHLNLPSINAPEMTGSITTERTARNVSGESQRFTVETSAPDNASIEASPSRFTLGPGEKVDLEITLNGEELSNGQYFGQIDLAPRGGGDAAVVMPVAFNKTDGEVALAHSCSPRRIDTGDSTECQVGATNQSSEDANIDLEVVGPDGVEVSDPSVPAQDLPNGFRYSGRLEGAKAPTVEGIEAEDGPGYTSLASLGVAPIGGVGDEGIVNLDAPAYLYGGEIYDSIGMVSNGYGVVGGGTSADVVCCPPQDIPNPASPNNVLAPFWTDLNPEEGGNLYAAEVSSDDGRNWLVLEWEDVAVFGVPEEAQTFQIWIETTPEAEAISYAFETVEGSGSSDGLVVGAENRDGTSGVQLDAAPASGDEYSILTTPPEEGGSVEISYTATGDEAGRYRIPARLTSDTQPGTTTEFAGLRVSGR